MLVFTGLIPVTEDFHYSMSDGWLIGDLKFVALKQAKYDPAVLASQKDCCCPFFEPYIAINSAPFLFLG